MTIRLTPSSLGYWYSSGCPARWLYSREFRTKETDEHFLLGRDVHSLMEGKYIKPERQKTAHRLHQNLLQLRNSLGLTVNPDAREITQTFKLKESALEVTWTRRIDALAVDQKGEVVIVDYKTSSGGWKELPGGRIPQALGLQSVGYTIPHPKETLADYGFGTSQVWPTKIAYLVTPLRGEAKAYVFEPTAEDIDNFYKLVDTASVAIQMAQSYPAAYAPKNRGYGCLKCEFAPMCYELEGYEDLYESKEEKNDEEV